MASGTTSSPFRVLLTGVSAGGGGLALLMSIPIAVIAVVILWNSFQPREYVLFEAGEPVQVPDKAFLDLGPWSVYSEVNDTPEPRVFEPGCVVLEPSGEVREEMTESSDAPLPTDAGELRHLASADDARAGDTVRCDGPDAQAAGTMALSVERNLGRTVGFVALATSVFFFLGGLLFSAVALAARPRRR